jgi:acetyl-CoA decarbonylase/synthase complex subunit delta
MFQFWKLHPLTEVDKVIKEVTLAFEFFKESYSGNIKEITLGKGDKAVTVGGEACYPFYQFEGAMPNKPKIAMEIWDMEPDEWPEAALSPFKDVVSDPAAWAKKCVEEYGAEMIVLQLKSTDPNGENASAEDAVASVKKVLGAVDVPLIIWGTASTEKDEEVLKKIAEECQGENLILGPVEDKNHKGIGAAAMGFGHSLISSSPIDVNLAKQCNILLENLGMPMDRIIIDPTTGGLGYGLEYSYSVMERIRMAALAQGDDKLQLPLINNLGNEVWKCKEAKQPADEAPLLGDPEKRPILMEAVGAVAYLMSGSNVLIMRHPESIRLVKAYIDLVSEGGTAADVAPIAKQLDDVEIDFLALSPDPDLTIPEEKAKKAAPAKKAAAPAKEAARPPPRLSLRKRRLRLPSLQHRRKHPKLKRRQTIRPTLKRQLKPRPKQKPSPNWMPRPRLKLLKRPGSRLKSMPKPRPKRTPRPKPRKPPARLLKIGPNPRPSLKKSVKNGPRNVKIWPASTQVLRPRKFQRPPRRSKNPWSTN